MYRKINKVITENYETSHVKLSFDDDDNINIYKSISKSQYNNTDPIFDVNVSGTYTFSATFKSNKNNYINVKAGSGPKYTDLQKNRLNWDEYKDLNYLPNHVKTSFISSDGIVSNYYTDELFSDNYSMDRMVMDQLWTDDIYIDKIQNNQYQYETGSGIVYISTKSNPDWPESQYRDTIKYDVGNNGKTFKIQMIHDPDTYMTIDILNQRLSFVKEGNTVKLKYTKS